MTIAFWCVLIAALIPYAMAVTAKAGDPTFSNRTPRAWYENLSTGYRQRAWWAQQNSFEVFPAFAAAVIIAHLAGASQTVVDALAVVFVLARTGYCACYLSNMPTPRSIVWSIGMLAVIGLFIAAAL